VFGPIPGLEPSTPIGLRRPAAASSSSNVQRDLIHAAQALAAVKAVGKPVRVILITHAHPDHYTGLGLFRQATADAIRYDTYGANAGTQADAPDITPRDFVVPGITFDGDTTLQIDGVTIIARELGAGEAPADKESAKSLSVPGLISATSRNIHNGRYAIGFLEQRPSTAQLPGDGQMGPPLAGVVVGVFFHARRSASRAACRRFIATR
jgi:hypothetical protein